MITWKFAQAMKQETFRQRMLWSFIPSASSQGFAGWFLAILLLALVISTAALNPDFLALCLNGGALAGAGLISVLNGGLQGATLAARISHTLASVRERKQYDLLCLLPPGAAHMNWLLTTTCLHRYQTFSSLSSGLVWVIRSIFILAGVLILARSNPYINSWAGPLLAMTQVGVLYTAFYIDDIQSVIVGSLIGMITATYASTPSDARLYGLIAFLLTQTLTYLATALLVFSVVPSFYSALQFRGILADISQVILVVASLYGLREALIRVLWQSAMMRLDISAADSFAIG